MWLYSPVCVIASQIQMALSVLCFNAYSVRSSYKGRLQSTNNGLYGTSTESLSSLQQFTNEVKLRNRFLFHLY